MLCSLILRITSDARHHYRILQTRNREPRKWKYLNNATQLISIRARIIIPLLGSNTVWFLSTKSCQQRSLRGSVNVEKSPMKIFNTLDSVTKDFSPSIFGQWEPSLGYFLGDVEVSVSHLEYISLIISKLCFDTGTSGHIWGESLHLGSQFCVITGYKGVSVGAQDTNSICSTVWF